MRTIKQQIKDVIQKDINEEVSSNLLFEEVKKVLKPFIGKPYNKRMDTALKKHFGDEYHVYVERIASLINLKIKGPWKGQSEYNQQNGFSLLIGYNSTETYQEGDGTREGQGINYFSLCYGNAALERIKQNKAFLKSDKKLDKLAKGIELFNEAKSILDSKEFDAYVMPSRYDINRAFKLKEGLLND